MSLTADRRAQLLPYAVSVGAEVCVLSALALSFRLAGTNWGVEGFALFALIRRVVSFALPVVTLGIDVAQPLTNPSCRTENPDIRCTTIPGFDDPPGPRLHFNFSPKL